MTGRLLLIGLAFAALAACGGNDPVAQDANKVDANADVDVLPPDEATDINGGGNAVPPSGDNAIPAALHGRWGLTPADCDLERTDAKGLMVVSAGEIRFYESAARPTTGVQSTLDSVAGDFAFTGEGQNWIRYVALQIENGNLVRTEIKPATSYTYARCR